MIQPNSVFKNPAARDNFRAHYNSILSRFPFEQKTVETAWGQTFILAAGPADAPPVILLHGSCSNSAFWFQEILALSVSHRVYAVDIIGEAGNSSEYRPELQGEDYASWLAAVQDALQLKNSAVAGNSLGGWMALKLATHYPSRVNRLILIATAGLAPVNPRFIKESERQLQATDATPIQTTYLGSPELPPEVLEFMNLIVASYNPIQDLPTFSNVELLKLSMPILLILGEQDAIINAPASAQRLANLVPSSDIRLLSGQGHVISGIADYLLPFLS